MRWLMTVALLTVSVTTAAYSGTFVNDFSNEHLEGWNIHIDPKPAFPPVPHLLNFEDGYLVINKNRVAQEHSVSLELGTRNAEEWDSYTLTFRIRFKGVPEPGAAFYTEVRRSNGGILNTLILPICTTRSQCGCYWTSVKRYMS